MLTEAPNGVVNKFALVRAGRPPSDAALRSYFVRRPDTPTQLWTDLAAAKGRDVPSVEFVAIAQRFLQGNDVARIPSYAALDQESSEISFLIAQGVRDESVSSINAILKQKYSTFFAAGGPGPAMRLQAWDHVAARLVSCDLGGTEKLLGVLRMLHVAEFHVTTQQDADERVLWADVVLPPELTSFIGYSQRDRRAEKLKAAGVDKMVRQAEAVARVNEALLSRAGKLFIEHSLQAGLIVAHAPTAPEIVNDGQKEVASMSGVRSDFTLDAEAIARLGSMQDLQNYLSSKSPNGILATASVITLSRNLDQASIAAASSLLGSLSTSEIVQADKALNKGAVLIASGAVIDTLVLARQLSDQTAFGFVLAPRGVIDDFAHPNSVQPAGIGDLKIVRQQLQKYALGELAHIENVLAGEVRERVHHLLDRTEQQLLLEEEETTESERDLQSTDRFELAQELESMRKEERQSEAGINVTASYGAVSISANAKTSSSQSAEQSIKTSQKNIRETVSRAVERVQRKTRRQKTVIMISEKSETNKHSFEAKDKATVGLYRYVEKHYWCQVLNYGSRLMIEFWIPEPAAYYLYSQQVTPRDQGNMIPPEEPSITPADITEYNYKSLAAKFRAEIPEPPKVILYQGQITLTADDQGQGGGGEGGKYVIPDEYEAVRAFGSYIFEYVSGQNASLTFAFGSHMWRSDAWQPTQYFFPALRKEIRLRGWGFNSTRWLCGISLILQRTEEALSKWQLDAYAAISASYRQTREEFDRRIAEAKLGQQKVAIRNDIEYRNIEKGELKRAVLEVLTNQHFDGFDAIDMVGQVPVIDTIAALKEGPIVRFFEHSFEWDNIVYTFYPYFWSRKSTWQEKLASGNTDPVFARFLGAGYSRVVIPVRRGYENHISVYLKSGIIWPDGEAPVIGSPEYLSIIDEIKSGDAAISTTPDQEGVPEGSPWQIKLPTNLVCIDIEAVKLPSWEVRPPGKPVLYVPSEDTCSGVPYNAAQWPDEKAILVEFGLLGYGLPANPGLNYLKTSDGKRLSKAVQRRANQIGASSSILGKNIAVDGVVGACTLRVLSLLSEMRLSGVWPGAGLP